MKLVYLFLLIGLFSIQSQSQIIVLDPGHGYGATTSDNPDGRTATEIETALEVGLRTRTLIQNSCAWAVYMTRTTNLNSWISVTQRATMANNWNADRILSIHCNAGGGTGTETFYCTADDTTTDPDIAFAQKVQTDMVANGSWNNRRCVEDNSFLAYHLGVLRYSTATGCLNELGFVDSADATKLTSSTWRDTFALSYFNTLKANLNLTCAAPVPGNFTLTASPTCNGTTSQVSLSWTAATNATTYDLYRNGTVYASNLTGTTYTNTAITVGTAYNYTVKAKNANGSTDNSNSIQTVTPTNCAPPGSFTLTATAECSGTTSRINLTWTTSATASSYDIYRNGALYASDVAGTQFLNTYITSGTTYTYSVTAKNNRGTTTNSNGMVSATALICPPGSFSLTATPTCSGTTSAINLTWTTSINATSYDIYRNGNLYASDITGTSFLNTYLIVAGTSYSYTIKAKNSAGTLSNANATQTATATSCSAAKGEIRSTNEDMDLLKVVLYPNPAFNSFWLEISQIPEFPLDCRIFDLSGKMVLSRTISPTNLEVNISELPAGIYVVKLWIKNKEITQKLIKK